DLERLLGDETAGDPMTEEKWVRSSTKKLRDRLRALGHRVGHSKVYRLLKEMGFSLKFNKKRRVASQSPERDDQFRYIASQKAAFHAAGMPVISIDTKKKEIIVLLCDFSFPSVLPWSPSRLWSAWRESSCGCMPVIDACFLVAPQRGVDHRH